MKLIDKYIFKEWGKAFLLSLTAIMMVILLAVVYDDLHHFIEKGASSRDIIAFFLTITPSFFPIIMPVALLISLLFILGQLNRNSEIVAMRSAGLSFWLITRSLWISGLLLSILLFFMSAQIIPWSIEKAKGIEQKIQFQFEAEKRDADTIGLINQLAFDNSQENRLWYLQQFSQFTKKAFGVNIYQRDHKGNEVSRVIAEEGYFHPKLQHWTFYNGREILFDSYGEPIRSNFFEKKDFPRWKEDPKLMATLAKKPRHLSLFQVRSVIKTLDYKTNQAVAKYAVKYYSMLASPLSCLIVVGIAIPFALSGVRTNPLVGVSKAIALFFLYYLIVNVSGILGSQLVISPWIAAWMPNLVMIALAAILYRRMAYS